jgi:hypothetical protein
MTIHNVQLLGDPIFNEGTFAVYVGYIDTPERKNDVPHYLIINTRYNVVEGSSASIFEARGHCAYLNAQYEAQEDMITKGVKLFEADDEHSDNAVAAASWKN